MTKTYAQVMKQIKALTAEADKLKRKEVQGVVDRMKEAINAYGLTAADLGLQGRAGAAAKSPGGRKTSRPGKRKNDQVKFRDESGNTWGGRGPRPRWLREALASGKELKDFAV
jgi:DNA-binding protein H-NS